MSLGLGHSTMNSYLPSELIHQTTDDFSPSRSPRPAKTPVGEAHVTSNPIKSPLLDRERAFTDVELQQAIAFKHSESRAPSDYSSSMSTATDTLSFAMEREHWRGLREIWNSEQAASSGLNVEEQEQEKSEKGQGQGQGRPHVTFAAKRVQLLIPLTRASRLSRVITACFPTASDFIHRYCVHLMQWEVTVFGPRIGVYESLNVMMHILLLVQLSYISAPGGSVLTWIVVGRVLEAFFWLDMIIRMIVMGELRYLQSARSQVQVRWSTVLNIVSSQSWNRC